MTEPTLAELDREALALMRELAAERIAAREADRLRRAHTPCFMCGLAESPEWRGPALKRGLGTICGRCSEWTFDSVGDPRDIAAAVLSGISTTYHRRSPHNLGRTAGLKFWGELDQDEPNTTPWAHVDVPALRREVVALARKGMFALPDNLDIDKPVTW